MPRSLARRLGHELLSLGRRWTTDDARAVLAALDASGLTIREFADREGLDPQRLYRWRAQIGETAPAFVEIARAAVGPGIEVVLRSGHVMRVPDGFGADTLRRLVEILDEGGSQC
jgi:transposase-like protein